MNLVAIVGRPNVGKSTIFNRILGERTSIIEDTPGVTRDRIYGNTDWNGKHFTLIDTGGFVPGSEDVFEKAIREQANIAMEEASVIIYVGDGRDGVTPFDTDIAQLLRKSKKPIVLCVNKCDNSIQDAYAFEFHALGLGEPYAISAVSGRSTGDLLDAVAEHLIATDDEEEDTRLKIAIVGRPNVGKSSITNALLGTERVIVTDVPGTTRDSVDSVLKYYQEEIILIDTAGLRRRSQIKENIEMISTFRTAKAIERCDVAIVVLDAVQGLEEQDKKIMNMVDEQRKGIILAVNKWDLVEKDSNTASQYTNAIHHLMKTLDFVPVVYTSAISKQRLHKLIDVAKLVSARRSTRISTSKLNKVILPELEATPPPSVQGKDLRINFITQVRTEPPVFAFFCNHPQMLPDAYKRFAERTIRKHFDLEGVPISFIFRRKNKKWEDFIDN